MFRCQTVAMYDPSMRVLTVLELLQARESLSGAELARRLEVSPRTVQRYVARLQDLGIPVESRRGQGGCYRLRPGFRLPPLMFGDDEALALALGLRALRQLGLTAFAPATEGANAKLERVLPSAVRERMRDVEEAVQLEPLAWTAEAEAGSVAALAAAVRARRAVSFGYTAHTGDQTRREVEPYGVVHLDARWYLVGRCRERGATRSFRLDRLRELALLPSHFERPEAFDARAHLRASLPFARTPYRIEVWLALPLAEARIRLGPSWVQLSEEDGGTRLSCSRAELEPFAATLLGLGADLEVLEPRELREVLGRLAERASRAAAGTDLRGGFPGAAR